MKKTNAEKAYWAASQVVRGVNAVCKTKEEREASRAAYEDWYDMFYELLTDTIDYSEYKQV